MPPCCSVVTIEGQPLTLDPTIKTIISPTPRQRVVGGDSQLLLLVFLDRCALSIAIEPDAVRISRSRSAISTARAAGRSPLQPRELRWRSKARRACAACSIAPRLFTKFRAEVAVFPASFLALRVVRERSLAATVFPVMTSERFAIPVKDADVASAFSTPRLFFLFVCLLVHLPCEAGVSRGLAR